MKKINVQKGISNKQMLNLVEELLTLNIITIKWEGMSYIEVQRSTL